MINEGFGHWRWMGLNKMSRKFDMRSALSDII
jgi:hypothetical protein